MLIGARQRCVEADTLLEKMRILKECGLDFLELALTRDEIAALNESSPEPYLEWIRESGTPILSTSMGHFPGFAGKPPQERAELIADVRRMIAFSKAVGADSILLATSEEGPVSDYLGIYRSELRPVADEALAAGITLALEHVGTYKPQQLAKLVRGIDHPAVGVYFDMGNCLHVGEDPLAAARVCAPVTVQLHIKGGPTTPLAAMPLAAVREILQAAGFANRGCLEISPTKFNRHLLEARALLTMAGY